jgi:apolipoprotein D and lipocalin family protein
MRLMKFSRARAILAALGLPALAMSLFSLAAPAAAFTAAPAPTKPVELQRYVGRWYEVARVPNRFERGKDCDAPTADYVQDAKGAVTVVQTCHESAPTGPEKVYHATAKILDPGTNAKFKLTFYVLLSKEYWVLDHAPDYKWAIVGDPTGKFLWLFSRQPTLAQGVKEAVLARAKALGYDIGRLEFPDHG